MFRKYFLLLLLLLNATFVISQNYIRTYQTIDQLKAVNEKLFFSANDGMTGPELWVTNGTSKGTFLLKDIRPGANGSEPSNLISFNNRLFFVAMHETQPWSQLWSSDGSPENTNIFSTVTNPSNLVVFKDQLYFTSGDGGLYKTSGQDGEIQIVDIMQFDRIRFLIATDEYFYYYKGGETQFLRTNGVQVSAIPFPDNAEEFTLLGFQRSDQNLFAIYSRNNNEDIRIYVWDEVPTAWNLLKEFDTSGNSRRQIGNFAKVNNKLFFSFNYDITDELWVSDGSPTGTQLVKSFELFPGDGDSHMTAFKEYQGTLYFRSGKLTGKALWKSDGTPEGTIKFHDVVVVTPDNSSNFFEESGGKLFFGGTPNELMLTSSKLWVTEGTPQSTREYFNHTQSGFSVPSKLTDVNGLLYFVTLEDVNKITLWNNNPSPEIAVNSDLNVPLDNYDKIDFGQHPINTCTNRQIQIVNAGLDYLAIDKIDITGRDFVIHGSVPELIQPGETVLVSIIFNPIAKGINAERLTIYSNDGNENMYVIEVTGEGMETSSQNPCNSSADFGAKVIIPVTGEQKIVIDNATISEMMPIGTMIGSLLIPGTSGEPTFQFVAGSGDGDNDAFMISGNQIISKEVFNHSTKSVYTIRVQGKDEATDPIEQQFIIRVENTPQILIENNCLPNAENMNFSASELATNSQGHLFMLSDHIWRSTDGSTWNPVTSTLNHSLSKAEFFNATGFSYGMTAIYKSEDHGANWFQLYVPLSELNFYNPLIVDVLNEDVLIVTDRSGDLFMTENGGRTWQRKARTNLRIRSMWFFDLNNAIVLTETSQLLKTDNGGNSWTSVTSFTFSNLKDMWFLTDKIGFVISPDGMYRTTNGGTTWGPIVNVTGVMNKIKFITGNIGYVFGSALYKTSNGGQSWIKIITPGLPSISGIAHLNNDPNAKMIVSSYGFSDQGRYMTSSTDGGITWQSINDLIMGNVYSISFVTASIGYLTTESEIFKTIDGGVNWRTLPPSLGLRYTSHYAIDEKNIVLSDGINIYRTSDGGNTISMVFPSDPRPDDYVPAGKIHGVNQNLLFSMNWEAMYRSSDGGYSWAKVPSGEFYTQDIHFLSEYIGYRLALFGGVQKTVDAGVTWQDIFIQAPDATEVHTSIYFLNEMTGFKLGTYLRKTTDGGITWTKVSGPYTGPMDVMFKDELHGYVISSFNSTVLHETVDGGKKWNSIHGFSDLSLNVHHANENIYCVGLMGAVTKFSNLQMKPMMPGYIVGNNIVCQGDVQSYFISHSYALDYRWTASGAIVVDNAANSTITFPESGEYEITVDQSNGCQLSDQRTLKVIVQQAPPVEIFGTLILKPGATKIPYSIKNPQSDITYFWDVIGAAEVKVESSSSISVNWDKSITNATITAFAVDRNLGCRNRQELKLDINTVVGIQDYTFNSVSVFPNPSYNTLTVKSHADENTHIQIYDVLGKIVFEDILNPFKELNIDVGRMQPGFYFLKSINGNSTIVTVRLIKY